jgi:solute carrier family 25 carnitine/acylcarnitine transporter 20/29
LSNEVAGQPFDIVKVRLQTSNQYSNALEAAKTIYAKEGPLAFYKGTLTPLIGIGACVSVQFGAFHEARRRFEAYNISKTPLNSGLSYSQYYAAGAFAGYKHSHTVQTDSTAAPSTVFANSLHMKVSYAVSTAVRL